MSIPTPDDKAAQLARRLGPSVERFVEYLAGDYARRVREMAIGQGLTDGEARYVVNTCMAAAAKAASQAVKSCLRDRGFARKS